MKKMFFTIILLCPVIFSLAQQSCNNYNPVISPDGNYLYFSSDRHGSNYEIYKSDIDGISNLERLTFTSYNNYFPALSPDGSKVLFQQNDYGSGAEIFVMNNDGSGLTQLTNNGVYDGFPNFSPDGQHIVFSGWDGEAYPEIFTMDPDGSNRVQITNLNGAYWQYAPKYNPAGDKIYFEAGYNADNHIVIMNTDGSNWVDITPPNSFGYAESVPCFSSDGSKIIFNTTEYLGYNNGSDIVITNADGSDWVKVSNATAGEYYYSPCFHPTDGRIFFTHFFNGGYLNLLTMQQDGSGIAELTTCSQVGFEDSPEISEIGFFPNPVSESLNVNSKEIYCVNIYDFTGRFVLQSLAGRIDVSGLENGIYTIQFLNTNNTVLKTDKLIKN
jgi:Tol biopolymer transport system component